MKIAVNLEKGRLPDLQFEFLGKMRSQRSLLKQVQLQESLILAIAGKTAESVDAAAAAGQVEVEKATEDDQVAIEKLLLALTKAMPSGKPRQVIIQQPFEIHIHKDATKPSKLEDGDYTLQITHTANHPRVRFPTDAIPAAEYKKVDDPASVVRFSDDLKTLKLVGLGGIGGLESRAGDTLVYTFDRGLDDSGGPSAQVIVKKSDKGITVTLIQFGSGVPVIVSHKGTLVEKDGDPTNKGSQAERLIDTLEKACKTYKLAVGTYPSSLQDLQRRPDGVAESQWGGPYLDTGNSALLDPWGRSLELHVHEDGQLTIRSKGPDGEAGTQDDIDNHEVAAQSQRGTLEETAKTQASAKSNGDAPLTWKSP